MDEQGEQRTVSSTTASDSAPGPDFMAELGLFLALLAYAFIALGFLLTGFFEIDRGATWIGAGASSGLGVVLAGLGLVLGARRRARARAWLGLALSVVAGAVYLALNV